VHHYNSTQYCSTETVLLIFPFLSINITSQMWPSAGKAGNKQGFVYLREAATNWHIWTQESTWLYLNR